MAKKIPASNLSRPPLPPLPRIRRHRIGRDGRTQWSDWYQSTAGYEEESSFHEYEYLSINDLRSRAAMAVENEALRAENEKLKAQLLIQPNPLEKEFPGLEKAELCFKKASEKSLHFFSPGMLTVQIGLRAETAAIITGILFAQGRLFQGTPGLYRWIDPESKNK